MAMRAGRFLSLCLLLCTSVWASETAGIILKDGKAEVSGKAIDKPSEWKAFLSALKGRAKDSRVCNVEFDAATPWSQLQAALTGASAAGFSIARIHWPIGSDSDLAIDLPGADAGNGEVVDLKLSDGEGEKVLVENEGQKLVVDAALIKGLLAQLPKATVAIAAPQKLPARKVMSVISLLADNRAVSVAFLPLKDIADHLTAEKKKTRDGEERAAGVRRMAHGMAN